MRISINSGWPLAALLFVVVLTPGSAWASVTNCPKEPKQNVPIVSGQTYYGASCLLNTTGDLDTFQFNAAAGDTWSMITGLGTTIASDICLTLYPPNSTISIFSGCTVAAFGVDAVATSQKLTTPGLYTIKVSEAVNGATTYGLSLERLSPPPPDGVPIVLSQNVVGAISTPTAQNPYTLVGSTSGVFQITASYLSGIDVCFAVYQPDGTIAVTVPVNPVCTVAAFGQDTITVDLTPGQNGTYVVVIYTVNNDGTTNYNFQVSCLSGNCTQPPPKCQLSDAPTYDAASGTLTMNFTLGTPVAVTWNGWLTSKNTIQSLFSQSQPITEPPAKITKTQTGVAKAGKVGILSTLTTPTGGITCSNFAVINTGTP